MYGPFSFYGLIDLLPISPTTDLSPSYHLPYVGSFFTVRILRVSGSRLRVSVEDISMSSLSTCIYTYVHTSVSVYVYINIFSSFTQREWLGQGVDTKFGGWIRK